MTEYYQGVTLTTKSGKKCIYTGPVQLVADDCVSLIQATEPMPMKEGMSFMPTKDIHDFDKEGEE